MSKIICDVCGTAYAETATQCPICGSVRPGEVATVSAGTENTEEKSYTYVKGGRFSKSNVKKRYKEKMASGQYEPAEEDYEEEPEERGNTGLIIAVVALTLAIIAAVIYIFFQLSGGFGGKQPTDPYIPDTTAQTAETTEPTETTELKVPCADLVVSKKNLTLSKKGDTYRLNVTTMPKDTTDEVTFSSSDEKVVTVSSTGEVTAVGNGEAVITITCGGKTTRCEVKCELEEEVTEPTEETEPTTPPVDESKKLELNRTEFMLFKKGETWKLYTGDIPKEQITWTTDDEKIVTVKDGVVTATGKGTTKVHAQYGTQKVSCTVYCSESVGAYEPGTDGETETKYTISTTDVTLNLGADDSFTLTLKDKDGKTVSVNWTASKENICTIDGNKITGIAAGMVYVRTEIDGETYECIVRVNDPQAEADT